MVWSPRLRPSFGPLDGEGSDPANWNDAWGFTPDKNYFPHGTKDYYNDQAQNASEYLVSGHGAAHGIDGGVSVLQLAKSIKADKNWKHRPVRLLVCKAANWAKELSEDLGGVQVFASYGYARMGVNGGAGAYAAFTTPNGGGNLSVCRN